MATVAEFEIQSEKFLLAAALTELPDAVVELERVVPTAEAVVPYFWVRGSDPDRVQTAFEDDPGVESVTLVDHVDGECLLCVIWTDEYEDVLRMLVESGVTLLSGVGTASGWEFEVRADDQGQLSAFQERASERGVPVTVTSLHALTPLDVVAGPALTDDQRDALVLAYERGYFDTPREVTQAEIADELGISRQALSARLRRGHRHLVAGVLLEGEPGA